jgi:hypothetical protein
MFYFSLGTVFLVFIASLFLRGRFLKRKFAKYSFYFSLLAVFIFILSLCVVQFLKWKAGDFSSYLIPPYQSINYFVSYCFNRFFLQYFISAGIAFLFLFGANFLNKKFGERFFEPEEPYFGAFGIFLSGFPGFIFYVLILAGAYLLFHLYFLVGRRSVRIPLYYLWLPAALFAIIMNNFIIQNLAVWQALKV